jgi:hypothetical protein
MSGSVAAAAVILVSLWLLVLTVATMLCIRQLGALTVRMQLLGLGSGTGGHGSSVGFRITDDLIRLEPAIGTGRRVVLLVSATCDTCAALIEELESNRVRTQLRLPEELLVLLPGRRADTAVDTAVELLDGRVMLILDPIATTLARGLKMSNLPSALLIEDGLITGNLLFVEELGQIDRLVAPRETSSDSADARSGEAGEPLPI